MTFTAGSFAGSPVRRIEDPSLLRGAGTYVDNLDVDGMLVAQFVRSPMAHALIRSIDTSAARAMPGVVGVYTADDLDFPAAPAFMLLHPDTGHNALAQGRVNYVGDPVAVVVAETRAQAVDAAELVEVDYEPLDAAIDMEAALAADAPLQFESIGSNVVIGMQTGSADPLADADVVVRGRFENQRVAVVPMEGSAIAVVPNDGDFDLVVHLACQMPHMITGVLSGSLGIDAERVRVIAPNVGGSFGAKHLSAEGVVTAKVAMELGRPVKWVETRSENMIAMAHGRGQVQYVELGLKRDGTIVGMRCRFIGDGGAYAGFGGILVVGQTKTMAQGVYHIPKIAFDVAVVVTQTTPMGAYRGAGRPEAAAFLERIIDMAADELGMDPAELRRKNFIQPDEFPYTTLMGANYDSGDYELALDEALRVADYPALLAEQAERRARDDRVQLGIGMSVYVEVTGWRLRVRRGRGARRRPGHGEGGHVGARAGPRDRVHADRRRPARRADGADRLRAVRHRARAARWRHRRVALGAARRHRGPADLQARGRQGQGARGRAARSGAGRHRRGGRRPPRRRRRAEQGPAVVRARAHGIGARRAADGAARHRAVGIHVPVRRARRGRRGRHRDRPGHAASALRGRRLRCDREPAARRRPGARRARVGHRQALWEQMVYDDDGNPLTTTLAEYAIPSAAELPSYVTSHPETPSPLNELGAKGIGESATVGSTPAVQNAVVDALSHLGVRHIDMPCTSERVWRAIQDARAGTLADPWREPPAAMASLPVEGAAEEALEHEAEEINL